MASAVQGGGAAGHGGDYVSLGAIPFIQCSIVRCGRRAAVGGVDRCLLYTSPSPRDRQKSRMPSSA